MNIFYLSECPMEAAFMQCNKHVVKMTLESAQMLSAAHNLVGEGGPYKITHKNHPCVKWVCASKSHYYWLYRHFLTLGDEYTERYGKVHKCIREYKWFFMTPPRYIEDNGFVPPPQCMPDECKHEDTVRAYNNYYMFKNKEWTEKGSPMVWT